MIEYTSKAIENCLLNWEELSRATEEMLVIVRADLDLAVGFLNKRDREAVAHIKVHGPDGFGWIVVKHTDGTGYSLPPVEAGHWRKIIGRLFNRLNILGLGGEEE